MTLVFDRIDDGSGQTHALVIGVGGYKHLFGGSDPKNQVIPQIGVLKQLTTAPRSAIAFAEFLIETQDQWRSPLGSVELLYSTPPEDDLQVPADFDAQGAAFAEIQEAYDAWRERCDKHQDNIAVLYFCGHGVEKEEQYLLAEDFGKSPGNPWLGSFAIDSTQLAFWACKAQTQCFFIDACREITDSMKEYDITVLPLETPNFSQPEADSTMIMKATAGRETALGPKKGVAYCTQALIRGFRGDAADQDGSGWVVRSGIISDRITRILRRVKNDQAFRQRCPCEVTKSTELLRLPDGVIPKLWLEVVCEPEEATSRARLSCTQLTLPGQPAAQQHTSVGEPIQKEVEAGTYVARSEFDDGEFLGAHDMYPASPPDFKIRLESVPT